MQKMLLIDYKKCTGCCTCEIVCSAQHEGENNPSRSRIHVVKWDWDGFMMPFACLQCEDAPCISVCRFKALSRDEEFGMVEIDEDRCIGCKLCVAICPFGGMAWDSMASKVIKCDFCDGDPACVRFCTTQAIRFVDAAQVHLEKQRSIIETIPERINKR